eukprot:TRINITY_DN47061_c0_g1_i5.p1 TRINITY_DN47061_c0_g1~~TRINITY_DN47061_c0_g1_i5.p1  ORF type:complete len:247 (+),score=19.36 TRINITY_DN47061_c0_g1_i5:73-813(+)
MDAAGLVAQLHGDLLRLIADNEQRHFQGLRSAAAHLRRGGKLNNKLAKKLTVLDDVFGFTRHITSASASILSRSVQDSINDNNHDYAEHPMEGTCGDDFANKKQIVEHLCTSTRSRSRSRSRSPSRSRTTISRSSYVRGSGPCWRDLASGLLIRRRRSHRVRVRWLRLPVRFSLTAQRAFRRTCLWLNIAAKLMMRDSKKKADMNRFDLMLKQLSSLPSKMRALQSSIEESTSSMKWAPSCFSSLQ